MTTTSHTRPLAALAALGGAAWVAVGTLMIADGEAIRTETLETTSAYVSAFTMAAALALTVAGIVLLARAIPASKAPIATGAGQLLLAVACLATAIKGEDPAWFIVAAPLANALWFFGAIAMARALRRAGSVPAVVAFGLPVVWVCSIPLSLLGLNVVAGAYWIAVGLSALLAPARPAFAARVA